MKTLTLSIAALALAGAGIAEHSRPGLKVQKATVVVDNGFKPSIINVKAGQPVQITFDTKHKACVSAVIFDGMNLTKQLTDGRKTVITFTPKKAGTYAFACPMKMMKGKVIAK